MRTDRRTDMAKLTVHVHNFANTPKNVYCRNYLQIHHQTACQLSPKNPTGTVQNDKLFKISFFPNAVLTAGQLFYYRQVRVCHLYFHSHKTAHVTTRGRFKWSCITSEVKLLHFVSDTWHLAPRRLLAHNNGLSECRHSYLPCGNKCVKRIDSLCVCVCVLARAYT
jgi:hypothetical protein